MSRFWGGKEEALLGARGRPLDRFQRMQGYRRRCCSRHRRSWGALSSDHGCVCELYFTAVLNFSSLIYPQGAGYQQAVEYLRKGSTIMAVGLPGKTTLDVSIWFTVFKVRTYPHLWGPLRLTMHYSSTEHQYHWFLCWQSTRFYRSTRYRCSWWGEVPLRREETWRHSGVSLVIVSSSQSC